MARAQKPETDGTPSFTAEPEGALAVRLIGLAEDSPAGLVHVAADEAKAERLARLARGLAPRLDVLMLPAWDCLPYDRASPSPLVMGKRVSVLRALAKREGPCLLLTTPAALLQRVAPAEFYTSAVHRIEVGDALDLEELRERLRRAGYIFDVRVDIVGEAALRGEVVDVFPADSPLPLRIDHAEGRVTGIRRYDPVTQLSHDEAGEAVLTPVSEAILGEGEEARLGLEHELPARVERLVTLSDLLPDARIALEAEAETWAASLLEQIRDAYESRLSQRRHGEALPAPLSPDRLYLTEEEWRAALDARDVIRVETGGPKEARVPRFAAAGAPNRTFAAFVAERRAAGERVVLASRTERDARLMARRAEAHVGEAPVEVADWKRAREAEPGALLAVRLDLDAGFAGVDDVTVIAAPDLLGSRADGRSDETSAAAQALLARDPVASGDLVIHLDHGLGRLEGLETVEANAQAQDTVRLAYAGEDILMVPVEEMGAIWRYGADSDAVSLDKLNGSSWEKRRAEVEAGIAEAAARMVALAAERRRVQAPKCVPPRNLYERFAAGFPYAETPDQTEAMRAILADLASDRPMDRLVCGDVGFGKTEVALRAAAAALLAGAQVALVAPTTVLARQHAGLFRRRFARFKIEVAELSRFVGPADARAAKAGLKDGSVRLVVATHALAGKDVAFKELGLLIIDEEQRFGARHKEKLRALSEGVHVLTLTATPIPRTLQGALAGVTEVSVIATPPSRRQPVRTTVAPFDDTVAREALLREKARGGQSFVVCPRVADIGPMAERLTTLVPELQVVTLHGKMKPEAIDEAMLGFADGEGDVLLATNIIESGLDVPTANTMLIWRADRFGLAQLHQLRGRVGRGAVRGVAYLLTDPEARLAAATQARLATFASHDRLGAGFAISASDLGERGGGDLFGEEQTGHTNLIGAALYRHLLERALRKAAGEAVEEDWLPHVSAGISARLPDTYMPDPDMRLRIYERAARLDDEAEADRLREEVEDRFGPLPEEAERALSLARLRAVCRVLGIERLEAGPKAVAAVFRDGRGPNGAPLPDPDMKWREERLLWMRESATDEERLALMQAFCERLAEAGA